MPVSVQRFQSAAEWVAALTTTGLAAAGLVTIESPNGPVELPDDADDLPVARTRADLPAEPPPAFPVPPSPGSRPPAGPSLPRRPSEADGFLPVRALGWPVLVSTVVAGLIGLAGVRLAVRVVTPVLTRLYADPPDTAGSPAGTGQGETP